MRVSENVQNEIFEERAQYLVNSDEMMFEMYGEPISDKRFVDLHEAPSYTDNIDIINKIRVADQLFDSKEYKTFIQLTSPKEFSERKFHPMSLKKLRSSELQDFNTIED